MCNSRTVLPLRAETAPKGVTREGPLTCLPATFAFGNCNGSFTSIRVILSLATIEGPGFGPPPKTIRQTEAGPGSESIGSRSRPFRN